MTDTAPDEQVNQALYQPHLPILQDPHRLRQLEMKFGRYFPNKEQFEAFAMLPIPDANRAELIQVMIEAQQESKTESDKKENMSVNNDTQDGASEKKNET